MTEPGRPSLAETQRRLSRWITAPEGVATVLVGDEERAAAELLRDDRGLAPAARLAVYGDAWFTRLHDALAKDYPVLAADLGPEVFHDLVKVYLLAHPSRSFSLRDLGFALAHELAAGPLAEVFARRCAHGADLARLEWALVEAFDAADAAPLERGDLASVAPERWAELGFHFTPSLRILSLAWPVHERLPPADSTDDAMPPPGEAFAARSTHLRVWRRDETVRWKEIDAEEIRLLRLAQAGAPFGALCHELAHDRPEDVAALRAAGLLEGWLAGGLLVGLRS
ncbi:MAG TPA: DNA-binding domain-containing protein [Myxococcota bacterium]|jgi:hypothetical protein|nr:DNA-binding domain-containing protein [Myxococcota bacterium]